MRKLIAAIAFLTVAIMPFQAYGAEAPPPSGEYIKHIEYKSATNKAFLEAAKKIVKNDNEAESFLRMAESAAKESTVHFTSGAYGLAIEDLDESTQLAVHAIILSMNKKDASIRDYILKEDIILQGKHDLERKEKMLEKGMAEVDTFIKAAERLLGENGNKAARAKLEKARLHNEASKERLMRRDIDGALAEVKKAYDLATGTVKDIKRSQNDIITFPKPTFTDDKQMLMYELKKNTTYEFFAAKVVTQGDAESKKMFDDGTELSKKAKTSMDDGKTKEAIKHLRDSTALLIKAIKHTYHED